MPILLTFSLNTFIKICSLDTGGRISEIQKRLTSSGGYDFYKPLHQAIRAYSAGDNEAANKILIKPSNETEKKHNQSAFQKFEDKFGSIRSLDAVKSPQKLNFAHAGISISVDPTFSFTQSGVQKVCTIWPTKSPQLTQKYGAVACHIMRRAYNGHSLANNSFYFADIVSGKIFSEKQITNNTSLILAADVNSIGTLIKEL